MDRLSGTWPQHGMSRAEAEELVRDLTAAGIEVQRVDEVLPGVFCLYYHVTQPYDHCAWIVHARRWRENVRAGLIEGIPRDAL